MGLKLLLKRGALVTAANWPVVLLQFVAESTFQVLLAVPIIGAAILVAVLLGADLADLLRGSLRDMFTTVASTLMSEPVALVAFITAFLVVLLGGLALMFLVKGGTVAVLVDANAVAGPVELEPITLDTFRAGARFTLPRFIDGCRRMCRSYLLLGFALMIIYAASGAGYLAFVVYGYDIAATRGLVLGWTVVAAMATGGLVVWITLVNLLYLLVQITLAADARDGAADGLGFGRAGRAVARFIYADLRELSGVFGVVLGLVIAATLASALAWSGVGLIAFIPLVGLAVIPLQLVALILRGLVFEYLGLTALGAYVTLYAMHTARRGAMELGVQSSELRMPEQIP